MPIIRTDPVERIVQIALDKRGIKYDDSGRLDFECEGFAIECKQYFTPRLMNQIKHRDNVIVIQGKYAAKVFAELIGKEDDA